jgi:hypothetical protein
VKKKYDQSEEGKISHHRKCSNSDSSTELIITTSGSEFKLTRLHRFIEIKQQRENG